MQMRHCANDNIFYTKPERITGSVRIIIVDVCLLRIPFANTMETPLKQLRETLFFSKRYEFTYKYKKLIGKKEGKIRSLHHCLCPQYTLCTKSLSH